MKNNIKIIALTLLSYVLLPSGTLAAERSPITLGDLSIFINAGYNVGSGSGTVKHTLHASRDVGDIEMAMDYSFDEFYLGFGAYLGDAQRHIIDVGLLFGSATIDSVSFSETVLTRIGSTGRTETYTIQEYTDNPSGSYSGGYVSYYFRTVPAKDFEYYVGVSYSYRSVPDITYKFYADLGFFGSGNYIGDDQANVGMVDTTDIKARVMYKQFTVDVAYGIDGDTIAVGVGYGF